MSFNLIAYLIYGVITYLITVRVGWIFYRNGIHFIRAELRDEAISQSVNRLLLTCYYLTNLGYITLQVWFWEDVSSVRMLVESLSQKVAYIVLLLGGLHFGNMTVIYLLRRKNFSKS